MILILDNYDSFTHNVADLLAEIADEELRVVRNDQISVQDAFRLSPTHLVISPGPGRPETAGISIELIRAFAGKIPILGVCLGHQAIASAFGGEVLRAAKPVHGKTSKIFHNGFGLFADIPNPFEATRYHSLIASKDSFPQELEITAQTEDGAIMGLKHRRFAIEGVQFHPESILTTHGAVLMKNFLYA